MRKITLQQFFESKKVLAINCKTEEEANALLETFDKMGKKWYDGVSYLKINPWWFFEEEICYQNNGYCSDKEWCRKKHYKVFKFKNVIFEEEK